MNDEKRQPSEAELLASFAHVGITEYDPEWKILEQFVTITDKLQFTRKPGSPHFTKPRTNTLGGWWTWLPNRPWGIGIHNHNNNQNDSSIVAASVKINLHEQNVMTVAIPLLHHIPRFQQLVEIISSYFLQSFLKIEMKETIDFWDKMNI